jgi:hypothetical protein
VARLVHFDRKITDALMTVIKYVKFTTGREATQNEVAASLTSYFIQNEIGNQIRYLRKKSNTETDKVDNARKRLNWTLNLIEGSQQNNLAIAGFFSESVGEGIQAARDFIKSTTGEEPSPKELADSLKCSFILSEIKNQIHWQRKSQKKKSIIKSGN